jgi:formylmethanofuran dehydrogenase subunit C
MKNLFEEFQPASIKRRLHTAETFHRENETAIASWLKSYQTLLADEIGNLFWQVNPEHLASVYSIIVKDLQNFNYSGHEIGAFCTRLDQNFSIPLHVPGPLGLYVSALINCCQDSEITFFTSGFKGIIHFIGYRLPEGKILTINGNSGDFAGAGLCGGMLVIKGSTGNWCGAGMTSGKIHVQGDAGFNLGQWMHGGSIQVDGVILSIGDKRFGGQVKNSGGNDTSI